MLQLQSVTATSTMTKRTLGDDRIDLAYISKLGITDSSYDRSKTRGGILVVISLSEPRTMSLSVIVSILWMERDIMMTTNLIKESI